MQKKTDKLFDKIVKKDYNNELEKVLEKKAFDENTKSLLLSILYKIETAYKDYEKVKVEVEEKEDFIQGIINSIKENCLVIKVVKLNTKESEILGSKTFLVEKDKKVLYVIPLKENYYIVLLKLIKKQRL